MRVRRELSPALSNRFTTVWVPALEDERELEAILAARMGTRAAGPAGGDARACNSSSVAGQEGWETELQVGVREVLQ